MTPAPNASSAPSTSSPSSAQHPELANIPFVIFGSSNGGATTYGFANYAPQRAICFVGNVSSRFNPETPVDGALEVPAVFVMGLYDPFMREAEGVQRVMDLVAAARKRGARWAAIVEEKGHEDGIAYDVYVKLVEQCIALRYPADADPSKGPVTLKSIPEAEGWLGEPVSERGKVPAIAKFADYPGDKSAAMWLPTEDMAAIYRAAATRMSPVNVGVEDVGRVYNPNTNPRTMFSIGGPVVEPGRELQLVCDAREVPNWKSITFYEGAKKLGEVNAGSAPTLPVRVDGKQVVWCLWAMVQTSDGKSWPTPPFYFAVKDPAQQLLSDGEKVLPQYRNAEMTGVKQAPSADYTPKQGVEDAGSVLLAYGLSAEQEKTFAAGTGVSAFWGQMGEDQDAIRMTQKDHAREGSSFSIVTTMDARMTVKAAYSTRGLFLLYEVTDNRFSDPDLKSYLAVDALDVLLDSHSSAYINDPANSKRFMNQGWGLFETTRQFQVAIGGAGQPPLVMRNLAEPWDFNSNRLTPEEAKSRYGIEVRTVKLDRFTRVQEWFIPWSELGMEGPPSAGTRLGFAPGYNDRDPGESTSKELRWIGKTSPWAHGVANGKAPRGWGDIEIGPMLAK